MNTSINLVRITVIAALSLHSLMASAGRTQEQRKELFRGATQRLKDTKIEEKAPKVGDIFPDLDLKGKKVSEYLKTGPVIVTFYRGGWCPYCVKQLKELEESLAKLKATKTTLIAISPERTSEVNKTKKKNKLSFPLISDEGNAIAKKLNLTFKVEKEVAEEYKALGIDLEASQGNKSYELPMPATFVIGPDRKIGYAYADADYTKRASLEEILKVLSQ